MKLKKVLLTILLAIVAIMLLQLQVKATEVDYSGYDYLLTETGVVAKNDLTGAETIIAGIKGEYSGTIEIMRDEINYNDVAKFTNFKAATVDFKEQIVFYMNGINSIDNLGYMGEQSINFYAIGDGILEHSGMICSSSEANGIADDLNGNFTIYLGSYIYEIEKVPENYYAKLSLHGKDELETYLTCNDNIDDVYYYSYGDNIVPANIFEELKKHPNTTLHIDVYPVGNTVVMFKGSDITNPTDFNAGVTYSYSPFENMLDTNVDKVMYIDFQHSGAVPGPIRISVPDSIFETRDKLKCYYYNETTKTYEQVEDAEMISFWELQLNIEHCSKFVVSKTELPAELVSENNNENTDKNWCVETKVDSLVWTEEDINSVLEAIEETRNNTTDKKLYVHVPSGSKVPAKIFESAKGINISIISEDGIWAEFSAGDYKAIDYVAGGTISNKAIDGMVNVGENTIVYLSLKHEGQLPSKCTISYIGGHTEIGIGGEFNTVKTKLYYFNEEVQKYELCGSGYMDLAYDLYVFEIDHCSSYVMSEEPLPAEFVIKTATEEENKKEEPKKEEAKKEDTTKAPGSIPYAGGTTVVVISMLAVVAIGIIAYKKNKELRGI